MSEVKRPTREVVSLIDIDEEMPGRGQTVWALSIGGVLCQVVWSTSSPDFYVAWMPFPKVPKTVKEKLTRLYQSGKSWGNKGNGIKSDSQPVTG